MYKCSCFEFIKATVEILPISIGQFYIWVAETSIVARFLAQFNYHCSLNNVANSKSGQSFEEPLHGISNKTNMQKVYYCNY